MKRSYPLLVSIFFYLVLAFALFLLWIVVPFTVTDEAKSALKGNEQVLVSIEDDIIFSPGELSQEPRGLILYPGARVDSEAYAPLALTLAEEGWVVILAQMPLDMAFLRIDAGRVIAQRNPQVRSWYIGGHSLGGAMACSCIDRNPGLFEGLLLLGAYPGDDTDLSDQELDVLSLYGSEDLIASETKISDRRQLLPSDTVYAELIGANHAGFGYYGPQRGDGQATISREQQTQMIRQLIELNWKQ